MEVKKVDFTDDKFKKVKRSKEDYRDKEVALLQYFINKTKNMKQ